MSTGIRGKKRTLLKIFRKAFYQSRFIQLVLGKPVTIAPYYFTIQLMDLSVGTFLLSLTIELAQLTGLFFTYPGSYRLFDVDDLMANTLGGFLGTVLSNKVIIHNQLMMAPRNSKYIIFNLSPNLGDYFRTHKLSISLMDCFLYM